MQNTAAAASVEAPLWAARPPAGWEPVALVCQAVFADLDRVVARINTEIQTEIPEYAPDVTSFSSSDMESTTRRNVIGFLRGIAENRSPDEEVLEFRRFVGQVSARRGFPLQPLMASFLLAYRVLWNTLIERAEAIGGDAPTMLLRAGSSIWRWMHETTNTLALAYNKELADRDATGARVLAHLLAELERDASGDEARSLASSLGFDPDGFFRALALTGSAMSAEVARDITGAVQRAGAFAASTQRGRAGMILVQGAESCLPSILDTLSKGGIGVGCYREGLAGALSSVREAGHALDLGMRRERVCWFENEWFQAVSLKHGHLEAMLETGTELARSKPHLAEAVQAFAKSGFSIADGARSLRISEGSFRYRLGRWETLTQWSPFQFESLARSMLAIELAAD